MVKWFPSPGYIQSEHGVVWLWLPLRNLYKWLTISSCYTQISLALRLIVRDVGVSSLCHSCRFACQQRVLNTFPGHGYVHFGDGGVWIGHPLASLYLWLTISSCYGSIPLALGLRVSYGGLSTLYHSCGLAYQQKVLETFPSSGYRHSDDGVAWLWHPLVNLYVWLTISCCYGSIPLALGSIVRDGGFTTLCQSCGFPCQQRVLKTFPCFGYLHSDYGVVWLWHPLVCLYIWLIISSS